MALPGASNKRKALPVEGGFNSIRGPEGLSATALYDTLKRRCDTSDETGFGDPDYYASEPAHVVFEIEGKHYSMLVKSAGFSCISPMLFLHAEPLERTWIFDKDVTNPEVSEFVVSGNDFIEYTWGYIVATEKVEVINRRSQMGKNIYESNYRLEYQEEFVPGKKIQVHAYYIPKEE